jgi:two-component system NtrC family sensor kinase
MKRYGLFIVIAIVSLPGLGWAQEAALPVLSEETFSQGVFAWRYHPGDDPAWAHPDVDDSAWETRTDVWFEPGDLPQSGWIGVGWFRLRFAVDSTLWNRPLAFFLYLRGAADVYLDGTLLATYGTVGTSEADEVSVLSSGPNPRFTSISFDRRAEHVLAVRHSNFVAASFYKVGGQVAGFEFRIGRPSELAAQISEDVQARTAIQYAFTGVPLAFALVFFLLFIFYPEGRNHLYFALLAAGVAAMTFLDLQLDFLTDSGQYRLYRQALGLAGSFTLLVLFRFLYGLFYTTLPRQFWAFLAAGVGLSLWSWFDPFGASDVGNLFGLLVFLEVLRTVVTAIVKKKFDAWIIGIGLLFFIGSAAYDVLLDLGWMRAIGEITNGYYYGFVGLLIAMAVYLSRAFARTNEDLKEQVVQVKTLSEKTLEQERHRLHLEAENERKALELEKAKELEASYRALEEAHRHLKSTQTQLIHAEKMASLGQLTAGIAHEIKNPLNFVNNFAQLSTELADELRDEFDAHPDQTLADAADDLGEILDDLKLNAAKIREHGQRADGIIKSMLEHARPASSQRQPTDLNALLDDYLNLCYHGLCSEQDDFPITFERDYDEAVGQMEVMPQEIGRVFFNLLNNAFYAVQEKERAATEAYQPRISVGTRRRDGAVEIRIGDNGPGIPRGLQEKIFEPFYTTKPTGSGTGLGLSLSYDIVTQRHGGTLAVESEEGEGTTFTITLPNVAGSAA